MKKWNIKTREYEPYSVPETWFCPLYCNDMDELINCASCGKKLTFGDCYTSRFIHTEHGFGYPICEKCKNHEFQVESISV